MKSIWTKKILLLTAIAGSVLFTGCVTASTPSLYTQNGRTMKWYSNYDVATCKKGDRVKSYKTGAIECYDAPGKSHVIYPVTQQQRNIDRHYAMQSINAQTDSMNQITNQLNQYSANQALITAARINSRPRTYDVNLHYGY